MLAGCIDTFDAGTDDEDDTLRVGVLVPDADRNVNGISIANGARLAADQYGTVLGKEIEIVVEDTKTSPLEARRSYQRHILESDVDVTVGITTDNTLEYLIEDIAQHETIHMTTAAPTQSVTQLVNSEYDRYKYHFRTLLNDLQMVELQLAFASNMFPRMGVDSIAVLAEGYRWTDDIVDGFDEIFEGNALGDVELTLSNQYSPHIDDFEPLYEEVEASGADMAWVAMAQTADTGMLDYQRVQPEFVFGGLHTRMQWPGYWNMTNGACQYGISVAPGTPTAEITDETQVFTQAYYDQFGTYPIYSGYTTYDGLRMYLEAVEAAGTTDEDEVIPALEQVEIEATVGSGWTFGGPDDTHTHDPDWQVGDESQPGALFFQWQETADGGAQEIIWPDAHATAEYQQPNWM